VDLFRDLRPHRERVELAEGGAGGGVAGFPVLLLDQRQEGAGGVDDLRVGRLRQRGQRWGWVGGHRSGGVEGQSGEGQQAEGECHDETSNDDPGAAGAPSCVDDRRWVLIGLIGARVFPDWRVPGLS